MKKIRDFACLLHLLWMLALPLSANAQASCPALGPGTGSPCDAGAGNPLNVMTGNKFQTEVDMPPLPGVLGLELIRHYNSLDSMAGSPRRHVGRGWRLSYDIEVVPDQTRRHISLYQADGSVLLYYRLPAQPGSVKGIVYRSSTPHQGDLVDHGTGASIRYTLTLPDRSRQGFDAAGLLVQKSMPSGEFVSLLREAQTGRLLQVTDPQGRQLHFNYRGRGDKSFHFRGVQSIDTPLGSYGYQYGEAPVQARNQTAQEQQHNLRIANLTEVRFPNGHARQYHFEDTRYPTLLTGISLREKAQTQRLVTWAYDAKGRAVLSVKGEYDKNKPGIEQVSLDFSGQKGNGSGVTVLTNSLGQVTRYSYAVFNGKPELTEVIGPGCASCGPSNVRHGYNRKGQRISTTRLDGQGQPLQSTLVQYDGAGRPLALHTVAYKGGKAQPAQLLRRMNYGLDADTLQPRLIARPSVVDGKEHQISLRYNPVGQIIEVTETGFEPLKQASISRTTRYAYQVINGRSVLRSIDGPLPNGAKGSPEDSDVTLIDWDEKGSFLAAIQEPGDQPSHVQQDKIGRIGRVETASASTDFEYDAMGMPIRISTTSPGWRHAQVQILRYDGLGHLIESGKQAGSRSNTEFLQRYDVAGRLLWRAQALGVLEHSRYDTEGRIMESGRYSNRMAQTLVYDFDSQGQLQGLRDGSGAHYRFRYTQGRLIGIDDAWGAVGGSRESGLTSPQIMDDFARIVATVSPDAGRTTRQFDVADRMVASVDAKANQGRYEYDLQGRVLEQTITDGVTGDIVQTRWVYRGRHLIALEHPSQSERYEYDARGLRTARIVRVKGPAGEYSSVTRYAYDDDGALQSTSLPDGSSLHYQRNAQGQVVAITRAHVQTAWLRWAAPEQTIVRDLQRDIVGLQSYTAGNGIQAESLRSRQGVLARTVYRNTREPSRPTAALDWLASVAHDAGPPESAANQALIDRNYFWDTRGNLLLSEDAGTKRSYAYDIGDRLIVAVANDGVSRYAYDGLGRRVLSQQGVQDQSDLGNTVKTLYAASGYRWTDAADIQPVYNPNGQPEQVGLRAYSWDSLGRLTEVRQDGRSLARYIYNHRGERIAKNGLQSMGYLYEDKQLAAELEGGQLKRQYIYLADLPIALIDTPKGKALATEKASVWRDIQTIAHIWLGTADEALVWLHTNHLGAPEAATNQQGQAIWQASYAPFGQARVKSHGFVLNLRLPGQYEDSESGLYYNRQRYYDPNRGQYLTPDPMGTPDGPDTYAYVNYNPLKYVDPEGLILFAFDGTNNSNPPPGKDTLSNVRKFYEAYNDGRRWYMNGVGRPDQDSGIGTDWAYQNNRDAGTAYTARERVDYMLDQLDQYVSGLAPNGKAISIDIVGFSRGAAMGRDFSNRVNTWISLNHWGKKTACVQLRFLGLWDTVAQFGTNGYDNTNWQLEVPASVKYAAQAIALNEHRVLFPAESIGMDYASSSATHITRGFIGSHSDIGGSYGSGDLSDVALIWMVAQAKLAHVQMDQLKSANRVVTDPLLHDMNINPLTGSIDTTGDREICDRKNNGRQINCRNQKQAILDAPSLDYAQTAKFITKYKTATTDVDGESKIVGEIDMKKYAEWLRKNYQIDVTYLSRYP